MSLKINLQLFSVFTQ